jgi:hypothetical protein
MYFVDKHRHGAVAVKFGDRGNTPQAITTDASTVYWMTPHSVIAAPKPRTFR